MDNAKTSKTIKSKLKMQVVTKGELILFSFLGFRFFWNSPDGKAMPILKESPDWLEPLIVMPYMFASLVAVHNRHGVKYFIREENEVVGTVILKVDKGRLGVRSLAVSPTKRNRGIGFFVLGQAEKLAQKSNLECLEVEVLKGNVSAQQLYRKFGFKPYFEGRLTVVFRKHV